mgnify:CR=1 FL=1|tara:strand:+ start:32557 stop:33900 length:1344 start_codon:yes stop_codon:yes gene_type:complete
MQHSERSSITSLASIFAFRMLGLFMILPVFALYAQSLPDATPVLIGIALGIYGLTQACLQLPFGFLSDRLGRKPIIAIGLLIFIAGSIVAALSQSIEGIIIGRAIQGAGAIGSVTIAFIADLTLEENRTKAMAMVGMTIGTAFMLAMVLGPILNTYIGVPGIFWLTADLACIGLLLLFKLPTPTNTHHQRDAEPIPALFKSMLMNKELLRLDLGIFVLHTVLTALFVVLPLLLQNIAGVPEHNQWMIYLPVLVVAFFTMLPLIIIAEKQRKIRRVYVGAIMLLLLAQLGLFTLPHHTWCIAILLWLFFTAFTALEALLPSLISKIAPAGSKGTAIGIYSTSQFLGIFVGGSVGGWLYGEHQLSGVFGFCIALLALWLLIAAFMKKPQYLATYTLNIGKMDTAQSALLQQRLLNQNGVAEALIDASEGVAYLKIDSQTCDKAALHKYT